MVAIIERIKAHHPAFRDAEVRAKQGTIKEPKVDREKRLVSGTVSASVPDLDNEVVLPKGLSRRYFPDAVQAVYYGHNYNDMPVGTCRNMALRDRGRALFATTYILPNERGDDLLTAIEGGAVNGFSIGFKATNFGQPTLDEMNEYGECDSIVREGVLIEYSFTAMPCCPAAVMETVRKSIRTESAKAFGLIDPPRRFFRAQPLFVGSDLVVAVRGRP